MKIYLYYNGQKMWDELSAITKLLLLLGWAFFIIIGFIFLKTNPSLAIVLICTAFVFLPGILFAIKWNIKSNYYIYREEYIYLHMSTPKLKSAKIRYDDIQFIEVGEPRIVPIANSVSLFSRAECVKRFGNYINLYDSNRSYLGIILFRNEDEELLKTRCDFKKLF